jgi:predicted dienelactone hydrolase
MRHFALTTVMMAAAAATPLAAENRIDGQSPDAPALAAYGPYQVGVRQLQFVNNDQVNILALSNAQPKPEPLPLYDRPLTVEVWYPAADGSAGDTALEAMIRDGQMVELEGKAIRDAALAVGGNPYPLLLLSHGFPGNRFLMSHLAENLASKGYVVASIDHTESTYDDYVDQFSSTLVNRPLDQLFVLNEMARLNNDPVSVFGGQIDTDNTALLGYSMGGYGALITAGAGVNSTAVAIGAPHGTLGIHQAGSATHEALPDPRIKTAIAIGPFGGEVFLAANYAISLWDPAGLAGIEIPTLFIAGSDDMVSGYANGVRKLWEQAVNSDRALLTFEDGSHNTVAPIPAPTESNDPDSPLGFNPKDHYSDPVWDDHVFMNNIGQHFVTAWLDKYLKGDLSKQEYLDLVNDGTFGDETTEWAGFKDGTVAGLMFETRSAAPAPVPLPATVWLLVAAMGGLGALRQRRRARA